MEMPTPIKVWTKEEASRALEVCKNELPELYLPLLLTLHLGLRKGEAIGLKWSDVDIVTGTIKVQRSYDGPTKNGRPRKLKLSRKLALELEKYYVIGEDNFHIFERCELNYHLRKLCKLAEVPKISWHQLRHYFASSALEAGVSPRLVQEVLGHTQLSTTINLYWSLFDTKIDLDFLP
jgi:integrase